MIHIQKLISAVAMPVSDTAAWEIPKEGVDPGRPQVVKGPRAKEGRG